jgi:hypothetical protein
LRGGFRGGIFGGFFWVNCGRPEVAVDGFEPVEQREKRRRVHLRGDDALWACVGGEEFFLLKKTFKRSPPSVLAR